MKYGLTFATFNPLICFGQVEDVVEAKSSAGLSIWRDDHPVHLTEATYGDIAAVLSTQAETTSKHLLLNSIFSTFIIPPANFWVGRYKYIDEKKKKQLAVQNIEI